MGRDIDHTDGGVAIFREDVANGQAAATLVAPADLTGASGSYDMELLDELPAGTEFLQIDASGKWTTNAGSAGSLDDAYNNGGPGAGRVITADNGAVEINTPAASGNNVLRLTQADNQTALFINKSGTGAGSAILIADAGTGVMIQATKTGSGLAMLVANLVGSLSVGDGIEVQGDSATGAFSVLSNDVGSNAVIKTFQFGNGPALHVDNSSNAFKARVRLEAGSGVVDSSVEFVQNAIQRWEIGYDQSALGLVLGRLSFANPVLFLEDTTGDVGINEVDPDAKLHVSSAAALASLIESSNAICRLGLRASGTANENQVGVQAVGNDLELFALGASIVLVRSTGVTIDQNTNNPSLVIDSEATDAPLIDFDPLASTNARGDISLGLRSAGASSPDEGDVWLDATNHRFEYHDGNQTRAWGTRFGPNFGPDEAKTISGGVITATSGSMVITGEGGVSDNLATITVTGAGPKNGDTILIRSVGTHTITVQSGTGNIRLNGGLNHSLNTFNDTLVLVWSSAASQWHFVSHGNNPS